MMVFKLTWIPYIFLIAGISFVYEGNNVIPGLFMMALGIIGIIIKSNNKAKDNQSKPTANQPKNHGTSQSQNSSTQSYCPQCGTMAIGEHSKFCNRCGTKLNR